MSTIAMTPEIDGLKERLKGIWMAGDYDQFSRYMEEGARIFYEQLDVPAGCVELFRKCYGISLYAGDGANRWRRGSNCGRWLACAKLSGDLRLTEERVPS